MKKIIALFFILSLTTGSNAQNARMDAKGNYTAISHKSDSTDKGKQTGKTFTDNTGKVYPVLESEKGKLYYIRTSKNGNQYRAYIKPESK